MKLLSLQYGALVTFYTSARSDALAVSQSTDSTTEHPTPEKLSENLFRRLASEKPNRLLEMLECEQLDAPWLGIAAECAGRIEDHDRVIPVLEKLVRHNSPLVREGAVSALGAYSSVPYASMMLKRIYESDPSPGVKLAARDFIGD